MVLIWKFYEIILCKIPLNYSRYSSNSSGDNVAYRVSSEEAESPLPNFSGGRRLPMKLVVKKATVPCRYGSPLQAPPESAYDNDP